MRRRAASLALLYAALSCSEPPTAVQMGEMADARSGGGGGTTCPGIPGKTTNVFLVPSTATLQRGQTIDLRATNQSGVEIADCNLRWSSANPATATVSSGGVVTAVAPGTVNVSASAVVAKRTLTGISVITVSAPPVASIAVAPATVTLAVGGSQELAATTRDAAGTVLTGRLVEWRSVDPTVASVSGTGVVTATPYLGAESRSTIITASSEGQTAQVAVTVTPTPVASISLTPSSARVAVGGTIQFDAVPKDGTGGVLTGRTVNWSSSDPTVMTITNAGLASTTPYTGASERTVVISATVEGRVASAAVSVTPAGVATIRLTPSSATLVVGATLQLSAEPLDGTGSALTGRLLEWSTSAPDIATVTASGLVAATSYTGSVERSVTITATSEGRTASATLTVRPAPVTQITVTPSALQVVVGQRQSLSAMLLDGSGNTLTDRSVVWSTSDPAVAMVDATGTVTASTYSGPLTRSTTVSASIGDVSGSTTVTVLPAAIATLELQTTSTAITSIGGSMQLTAVPRDANGSALTGRSVSWSTSDERILEVSTTGVVTGRAIGSATVTAVAGGSTALLTISVTQVAASLTLDVSQVSLDSIGARRQLTAVVRDAGGTPIPDAPLTWTSSNGATVQSSASGLLSATGRGTATVTAQSGDVSASVAVVVVAAPCEADAGNLVVNCSFEISGTPGANYTGDLLAGGGWTQSAGSGIGGDGSTLLCYDPYANYGTCSFSARTQPWRHSDQRYCTPGGSDACTGRLMQSVPTVPGARYLVRFHLAHPWYQLEWDYGFSASFAGVSLLNIRQVWWMGYTSVDYTYRSFARWFEFEVTATAETSELRFTNWHTNAAWLIDDVTVRRLP